MIAFSANETKHISRSDKLRRYQKNLKFYLFSNETNINCDFATSCGRLSFGLHVCGLDPQDVDDIFPLLESFMAAVLRHLWNNYNDATNEGITWIYGTSTY